ncbi:helix-turn-helix transcriptional regulator [Bdellovibrionales bacterium]|nr:helix-turn-helix transcriptional regulator [Bdellovibrionales bacterium]
MNKLKSFIILGKYLREKRVSLNLTQREVAKELGYTTAQFLSNVERGVCAFPIDQLGKLSRLYDIDKQEILNLLMDEYEDIFRKALKMKRRLGRRRGV